MAGEEKITTSVASHNEQSSLSDEPKVRADEIQDGDLALQVLHTHFEPYTKDEEKRLLRKIDFRLALLMLFVNGIQFVDKLVSASSLCAPVYTVLTKWKDHLPSGYLWSRQGSSSEGPGILSLNQHLLHRLPSGAIPDKCSHAALPDWQIYYRQLCPLGCRVDLYGILHQLRNVHGCSILPWCL